MITDSEISQLESLLVKWFDFVDVTKPHFWDRNTIAIQIKEVMQKTGRWRVRSRSNPRKAYLVMKAKQVKVSDW